MPIHFKDFFPKVLERGFFSNTSEDVNQMVLRMNEWLAETGVRVVNVETVLLPDVGKTEETGESTSSASGDFVTWTQFLRVWFELPA